MNKSADDRLKEIKATIKKTTSSYKDALLTRLNTELGKLSPQARTTLSGSLHMKKEATKEVRDMIRAIGLLEAMFIPADNRRTFTQIVNDHKADPSFLVLSSLNKLIKSLDPANPSPPDLGRHRPLLIGVSISGGDHPGPGSIACFVLCNKTNRAMILGNEHVMRAEFGSTNTDKPIILQPSKGNGGSASDKIATYDRGILDHRIDAAVAYLEPGVLYANRTPEGTALRLSSSVVRVGDEVWKRGTASRVTQGRIVDVAANKKVPHARFGGDIFFAKQLEVKVSGLQTEFQIPGDSGSALFNANNDIIGLMHGGGKDGGGIATPIEVVFDLLDVRLP